MRIAFIHDWECDIYQEMTWADGLAAAVRILSERHDLRFFTCGKDVTVLPHPYFPIHVRQSGDDMTQAVREFDPDVILHWADCTRPNAETLFALGKPMALCFAGGDPNGHTSVFFDHFFVESDVYRRRFELVDKSVSTAFGTNTGLFTPIPNMARQFDVVFPATYCNWKRHPLFTKSVAGLRAITAGFMYPVSERYCWEDTQKAGVFTLPHVSAETLRHIYAASGVCVITSMTTGGSQRTVLEAMAMNVPLVVMSDSDKTSEYVIEAGEGFVVDPDPEKIREAIHTALNTKVSTREYVMDKWSEYVYADNLEAGLRKLL